jgi:trigger factor
MKASVEPLEGNKVKLSVEVDEQEFERALDQAFRKIAREVRIPGFRPGKAPRRVLEARLGKDAARTEALRDSLPDYYAQAIREQDLDAIAPPEIDITAGEESGPVTFDAVVEVRPQITVPGYGGLRVTVPNPAVTDEDISGQVDRLRGNFGTLETVTRPARDGDYLTVDLKATEGENVLHETTDELYELGSGSIMPKVDEELQGARAGDILRFSAEMPGHEGHDHEIPIISFTVLVKEVKEKILPELTDDWASEASEFDTVDELREDIAKRIRVVKAVRAQMTLRNGVVDALIELVEDDIPEALVNSELSRRIHDLGHRLEEQGATIAQYIQATGQTEDAVLEELRVSATQAVKADLALRAVAEAEDLEVTDDDLDTEIERLAERTRMKPKDVLRQLERADQLPAVRSDIKKAKALEWLVEHAELVDEEGHPVDRADLSPQVEQGEQDTDENDDTGGELAGASQTGES